MRIGGQLSFLRGAGKDRSFGNVNVASIIGEDASRWEVEAACGSNICGFAICYDGKDR